MTNLLRILIHAKPAGDVVSVVAERHPDAVVAVCDSYDAAPRMIAEFRPEIVYSVRFLGGLNFPSRALVENDTIRWVSVGGSGTDHFRPWDPAHVTITNAADVAADMMAQYAIGVMLSFSLGYPGFERDKQEHRWNRAAFVEPVAGKTVLVVGLGKTGQAVARLSKALGLVVLGVRAHPQATAAVDEVHAVDALEAVLPRADFIVVSVPLVPATRHLIDVRAFAVMSSRAVLIDMSRGGIVDQAALIDALRSQRIKGAALDVFETEPLPTDNPLWDFPNVRISPHCSGVYPGWERRAATMFCDNLDRWRAGIPLENVVDPQRGY